MNRSSDSSRLVSGSSSAPKDVYFNKSGSPNIAEGPPSLIPPIRGRMGATSVPNTPCPGRTHPEDTLWELIPCDNTYGSEPVSNDDKEEKDPAFHDGTDKVLKSDKHPSITPNNGKSRQPANRIAKPAFAERKAREDHSVKGMEKAKEKLKPLIPRQESLTETNLRQLHAAVMFFNHSGNGVWRSIPMPDSPLSWLAGEKTNSIMSPEEKTPASVARRRQRVDKTPAAVPSPKRQAVQKPTIPTAAQRKEPKTKMPEMSIGEDLRFPLQRVYSAQFKCWGHDSDCCRVLWRVLDGLVKFCHTGGV